MINRLSLKLLLGIIYFLPISSAFSQPDPSKIDIVRDKWGVPHIYAPTDAGASYGLAWAHAEDDFGTIQQTIMAGKRMVGRKAGPKGAAIDYFVHLIKAKEVVDEKINTISPTYRKVLEGYVAGLNSYAEKHPKEVVLKKLFPVTVKEALTAYVLSLSVLSGVDKIVGDLFKNKINENPYNENGSNAMAISKRKTTDGYTYLTVNSHQPLEGPVSWYEAHLNSDEGWNMLGGLFAGGATPFQGTNENLGWTHTVNYPDKVDLYKLRMHPAKKNLYKFDGEWLELEERKIKLKVKLMGLPITIKKKAYWSVYGATVKNDFGYYSVRFGANMDIRVGEQWYWMNKASNFEEFKKALDMVAISGFNIGYADKEDNIFYASNGKLPMRDPAYDWKKVLPGNTSATLWTDFHPFSDLPQIENPKSGYIFNTNNTVYSASGPEDNIQPEDIDQTMGFPFRNNNRSIRFMELIAQYDKLSYDDFKTIKYDITLPDSLHFTLDANILFKLDEAKYPLYADFIIKLKQWDRRASKESTGATLFKLIYDQSRKDKFASFTEQDAIRYIKEAQEFLLDKYKTIEVPLGKYQVHQKGNVELPVEGLPDVIAALNTRSYGDKVRASHGDSHVMMIRYDKDGPIIESINAYGASNRPDSPHYTDQMELYVKHGLKPMTLNKEKIYKEAESIYHPE